MKSQYFYSVQIFTHMQLQGVAYYKSFTKMLETYTKCNIFIQLYSSVIKTNLRNGSPKLNILPSILLVVTSFKYL